MTILPKKKLPKDKTEGETLEPPRSPPGENRGHVTHSSRRQGSPPPRWNSPAPIDERLTIQDPGGRFEEPSTSHNKRRHRSSPHRTGRKHRHSERGQHHASRSAWSESSQAPSSSHPHSNHRTYRPPKSSAAECVVEPVEEGYNSGDEYVSPQPLPTGNAPTQSLEELEQCFETALKEKKGFIIKRMGEDGACMFRAVADQVYGDQEMHSVVRKHCVDYMSKNADFYQQYVTEDFTTYINRKRIDHCHGNHVEMQALSEIYNRPIEVYQYSTEPINTFHGAYKTDNEPIRLSYHGGVHYNSVTDPYKATIGVGLGLPGFQPGLAEKNLMCDAMRQSEEMHLEQAMLEDKMREADWEVTQEEMDEQVARESYIQWLCDQEKRAKSHTAGRSASAACSSSASSDARWDSIASPHSPDSRKQRSPRSNGSKSGNNSTQNSPHRLEPSEQVPSPPHPHPAEMLTTVPGGSVSPKPSTSALGAVGGSLMGFSETSSMMNAFNPAMYGLSDWDEDDIITQVMAQSQEEYLQSLKAQKGQSSHPAHSTAYTSSSATSVASSYPFSFSPQQQGYGAGSLSPSASATNSLADS